MDSLGNTIQGSISGNSYSITFTGGQSISTLSLFFKNKTTGNVIKSKSGSIQSSRLGILPIQNETMNVTLSSDINVIYSPIPSNQNTYIVIP